MAKDAISGATSGAAAGSVVPGLGTIAGGLIGLAGGMLGSMFSGADQDRARQATLDAIREIESVGLPPDLAKPFLLEKFKQVGLYSPQLESQMDMAFSQAANIQEDPSLRSAQVNALQRFGQLSKTGMGPQDIANLLRIQQNVASDVEGKRQQIIQNMQARGQAGSGAELAAALEATQSGGNRLANEQLQAAGQASQRALSALGSYGDLSSRLRGQDFDIERAKAQAADELTKFNLQNSINRQMRNVSAQNQAQLFNLQNQQQIANANIQQANEETRRQAQAQRDYWNDLLKQRQMVAGAKQAEAGYYQSMADQTRDRAGSIAGGLGDIATGYFDAADKEKLRQAEMARQDKLRKEDMNFQRELMNQSRQANLSNYNAPSSYGIPSSLSDYSFFKV